MENRRQMEEIYQQKLNVCRKVKRKLSPIKMEKNEAQRFQIMSKRFQDKEVSKTGLNNNTSRAVTLDKLMERSQSHRTHESKKM